RPTRALPEQRRVRIEAADVDGAFFRRPFDEAVASRPGELDQHFDEIAMRDVLVTADVERFAVHRIVRAGDEKRLDGVFNVHEVANLRTVAEDLNLLIFEHQPDEPAD